MYKKPRRDTYHIKDLKRMLLRSVRDELREHGVDSASLRRIASRAGVSHAAPYRHYRGKEGLLAALCWEGMEEFTALLRKARESGTSASDRLFKLGEAYLSFAEGDPAAFQLMFSEIGMRAIRANPPADPAKTRADYDSFGVLETTVKECQAEGILDAEEDSGALAMLIWSYIHGLAHIRREGFAADMGASRGLDAETTTRMVMSAFRGLVLGATGRRTRPRS